MPGCHYFVSHFVKNFAATLPDRKQRCRRHFLGARQSRLALKNARPVNDVIFKNFVNCLQRLRFRDCKLTGKTGIGSLS